MNARQSLEAYVRGCDERNAADALWSLLELARRVCDMSDERLTEFVEAWPLAYFDVGWSGEADEYRTLLFAEIERAEEAIGRVLSL